MNRILLSFFATLAITITASAQGNIRMVSTYQCDVPATMLTAESDELDSLVTQYAAEGADTLMIATFRYERATGSLLEKQVALTDAYLERVGYNGGQRPYFYQYRYDELGREIYSCDYLKGVYRVIDYTERQSVVKSFDVATRKLLDQELKPAGTPIALIKKGSH
jgi:hypothetical protein